MSTSDDDFQVRAERRRRTWRGGLVAEQRAMQASETTIEQRIAAMWAVAETAWAFAGQPMPTYTRETMPGRVIRPK